MNLKTSSSPGPDKISSKFLQTFANEVSVPLTHIFKKSMISGDVPSDWKHANVTPIFKKGAKSDPGIIIDQSHSLPYHANSLSL